MAQQKLSQLHKNCKDGMNTMNLINLDTEIDDDAYDILPKSNIKYDLDQLTVPISKREIETALKQLKKNSAPGIDKISTEILTLTSEATVSWMKALADQIWKEEAVPRDWKNQITIPVFKKGQKSDCNNYRGIAILCVTNKIISRTILNRLIPVLDSQLNESQCGFRSNRGCSDQLFNLRIIMQRAKEYNTPLYLSFIDLCKALDSINRNALWKVLRHSYNLPSKIINIIKAFHEETQGVVRYEGQTSKEFPIRSGVKQGDILSPLLFNLYLNAIINSALENHKNIGAKIMYNIKALLMNNKCKLDSRTTVQHLLYADDMVIIGTNYEELNCLMNTIEKNLKIFGLKINIDKTKRMTILPKQKKLPKQTSSNNFLKNRKSETIQVFGSHSHR